MPGILYKLKIFVYTEDDVKSYQNDHCKTILT